MFIRFRFDILRGVLIFLLMKALPAEYLPVLPIRQTVMFPGVSMPMRVARPRSIAALEKAMEKGWPLVVLAQKNGELETDPTESDLYRIGTLCKIERVRGSKEDGYQILVRGVSRFKILESIDRGGMLEVHGSVLEDLVDVDDGTRQALLNNIKTMARDILNLLPGSAKQLSELLAGIDDLSFIMNLCAANLDIEVEKKQSLLELVSLRGRSMMLFELLQEKKNNLQVTSDIRDRLSQKFGKEQRKHILREQMRIIKEELGENSGEAGASSSKKGDYREKIKNAKMPEDINTLALEELNRLEEIGNSSPEANVIRNYLDLLCSLPWSISASESIDLVKSKEILDRDHYGLAKIKKRILQHLAVLKLLSNKNDLAAAEGKEGNKSAGKRGSILLFVGPPGVGKTSLGQSIAKALGRKFVRVSLGGVRDDAEIRGHRRTYIGAMPGRIIQGIKRAGENNPVMLLDEIDKLGNSFQGSPASAMLEVLDPEQNNSFQDHYLDVPFDLSKVFFIATANSLETIPAPLLDRMEVIEMGGYTTAEKFHIAKTHLIPKQMAEHGLEAAQFGISDEALLKIINSYTREAGVRNLEQKVSSVCRGSTERVLAENAVLPIKVEIQDLDEILGGERFVHEVAERIAPPGVVTGLAWTPVGGEILFIESSLMPGSGRLILTGQLGDVMKESAQIALSLVRSRLASTQAVAEQEKKDIHIHVPQGAIPKDGPSAGIAIATTLASLFLGKSVDPKLAMTGEITLRGAVMPVGGIKEKVIAAHRAGITRIIMSKQNERDLREVPDEVKAQMKFEFADNISEVLNFALGLVIDPMPQLENKDSNGPPSIGIA